MSNSGMEEIIFSSNSPGPAGEIRAGSCNLAEGVALIRYSSGGKKKRKNLFCRGANYREVGSSSKRSRDGLRENSYRRQEEKEKYGIVYYVVDRRAFCFAITRTDTFKKLFDNFINSFFLLVRVLSHPAVGKLRSDWITWTIICGVP